MNRSIIQQLALATALSSLTAVSAVAQAQASHTRHAAAHALKAPTYEGRTAESWTADLSAPAPTTRVVAAYALGNMREQAASAVPALIKVLDDPTGVAQYAAAYALGEIGPSAAAALPRLQKMNDDQNDDLVNISSKSIRKIKGELPTGMPAYAGQQTSPKPSTNH